MRLLKGWCRGALLGTGFVAAGCASSGPGDGHEAREELIALVEEAEGELQLTREQIHGTMDRYNLVMSQEGSNPVAAYEDFARSLVSSEERVAALADFLEDMEESSADYFDRWEKDFEQYSREDLKRASQENLHTCRRRYGNIRTALAPAQARTDQFLANLRDQMLFLKYDLSPAAVKFLQKDALKLNKASQQLVASLDAAIVASDRFVDGMSVGITATDTMEPVEEEGEAEPAPDADSPEADAPAQAVAPEKADAPKGGR